MFRTWMRLAALITLAGARAGSAQVVEPVDLLREKDPRPQIMLLGTFHFRNAGLDAYKPKYSVDIMSEQRQREVADVVDRLAQFAPNKIAVEARPERQAQLDSLYQAYRQGKWSLTENEIYQLGFRLAARLGHERVYAVDAPARTFLAGVTQAQWDSLTAQYPPISGTWNRRYTAWYAWQDSVKTTVTLREFLTYLNEPETIRRSHGAYFNGGFERRHADDYFGPDANTYWWNRNLRVFSNLQRLASAPSDRVLFIVGAGHLSLLQHAIDSSPRYELVDARKFLR